MSSSTAQSAAGRPLTLDVSRPTAPSTASPPEGCTTPTIVSQSPGGSIRIRAKGGTIDAAMSEELLTSAAMNDAVAVVPPCVYTFVHRGWYFEASRAPMFSGAQLQGWAPQLAGRVTQLPEALFAGNWLSFVKLPPREAESQPVSPPCSQTPSLPPSPPDAAPTDGPTDGQRSSDGPTDGQRSSDDGAAPSSAAPRGRAGPRVARGFQIVLDAEGSLEGCAVERFSSHEAPLGKFEPVMPKVAQEEVWKKKLENAQKVADVRVLVSTSDWTFASRYWGSAYRHGRATGLDCVVTEEQLPLAMLCDEAKPILWFQQVDLYDDDLSDFGLCRVDAKVRVMPDFWFALTRQSIRVDNVLFRQIDCRLFHMFGSDFVLREFIWKQATVEDLKKRGHSFDPGNEKANHVNVGSDLLDSSDICHRVMYKIMIPTDCIVD
eukprot:Selendium_serpulae@DN5784_c0_g1_i1.p1